jgi:20S proteasome subunit beta 2
VSSNGLEANGMHRYQGHIGAALVLGGVDVTGPQLFTVAPHGSTDKLPYVTMGSGSLAAMAVFETYWKTGLDVSLSYPLAKNRN